MHYDELAVHAKGHREHRDMKSFITIKKYVLNVMISVDQLGNAVIGGDPDETISSVLGKLKQAGNGSISWAHPVSKLVDFFLEKIDKNHSTDAIEKDEGKNDLRNK